MKIKRTDIFFAAVIGFILIFSFYFSFLRNQRLKELNVQKKSISLEIEKGKEVRAELGRLGHEINIIEAKSKEFENRLPDRKNIEDFMVQINDIAVRTGLRIAAIRPQGITQKELYGEVPIEINASSTYGEFYSFVYLLKKIPRINKIETFTIKKKGDNSNQCGIDMVLKIFVSGKGE